MTEPIKLKKARNPAAQARSRETVAVILEAAARVLEAEGLAGYNTNAIARRAGVSIGSIYQYFVNKDAITRALIARFETEMATACDAAIQALKGKSLPDAVALIVDVVVDQHLRRPVLNLILESEEHRLVHPSANGVSDDLLIAFLTPYREEIGVPLAQAACDTLTIARAVTDATFREGVDRAGCRDRVTRALLGYLTYR